LYLNFTNTSAGGYSVYGALEAISIIEKQHQLGLIGSFENDFYKLQSLKPEFSNGLNAGVNFKKGKLTLQLNLFRNDIADLIESRQVATRIDNTQLYSYINVKRAYTQGLELNGTYKMSSCLTLNAGYQFLQTADKDQLDNIKQGLYYIRDGNGLVRLMQKSDYVGLPNRSPHMGSLKITYETVDKKWFANIRAIYRSAWVVSDRDGNGVYNKQDDFAKGFVQLNTSVGHIFKHGMKCQVGADNILNHVDPINLPNQAGNTFYGSLTYQFNSSTNNKNSNKKQQKK